MSLELCDSHTHLDAPEFAEDCEEVIARARTSGVSRIISIGSGYGLESARRTVQLAENHHGMWAAVGVHPHEVETPYSLDELRDLGKHEKVVAIGEIGLDVFRNRSPFDLQEKHFRIQVELAKDLKKPLSIHSREAGAKVLKILKELHAEEAGGVFHCYAEDADFAKELADMNFAVSFTGAITFKNADKTREIAKAIPLGQILIETDAPYLTPVPNRGKRCESSMLVLTAEALAKIKGLSFEEVAETTTQNAIRDFNLA